MPAGVIEPNPSPRVGVSLGGARQLGMATDAAAIVLNHSGPLRLPGNLTLPKEHGVVIFKGDGVLCGAPP
eukprot:6525238-Lingulodinium_polyedra.AAC.1